MPTIKNIGFCLFVFLGVLFSTTEAKAQIPDKIIVSLRQGNSKVLSNYFNQNVELVVLENDNVYSKAQAEQIVHNFFSEYKPESFKIIHQGGKEAKYVIGNLTTNKQTFRVYFLLKQTNQKEYIHQLRIEKQP